MLRRATLVLALSTAALCAAAPALGYTWPVKPFKKMHALRGGFDDPRYHVGAEGALSAFHFGVDIAVRDGTPVYSVSSGWALRHNADVTVHRGPTDRAFGYWHIRPVVRNGQRVRVHQLLGYVRKGWGHVHFSESVGGIYVNPLRKSALTPYRDKTIPVVSAIRFVTPPEMSDWKVAPSVAVLSAHFTRASVPRSGGSSRIGVKVERASEAARTSS